MSDEAPADEAADDNSYKPKVNLMSFAGDKLPFQDQFSRSNILFLN